MTKTRSRTILITGVSTGIGHDSARAFLARGYQVFGTVRTAADAAGLKNQMPAGFEPLILDVTDGPAVEREIGTLSARLQDGADAGCLGGLNNNAGIALPGPLSEQSFEQIRRMFDVNLFGVLAVTRAALPLLGCAPATAARPGRS
jgi:NADP-dependent 3-hydroxy acid dehydrogenase YdfG